jgi:hypothetical protein
MGLKRKEQKKPKTALVWRTGQCPVHQGGSTPTCHLRVSEKSHSAIIHRTVRCATRLSGVPCGATATAPRSSAKGEP